MSDEISQEAILSWDDAVRVWKEYLLARYNLHHSHRAELLALVKRALRSGPDHPSVAFEMIGTLTPEEKKACLPELLGLCSSGRYAGHAKDLILEMPRDWLTENIEAASESTLALNDFLDWVNLLEVLDRVDSGLGRRLAERMLAHSDPDLREWGAEFLQKQKGA
jgi:hypothetical protein